MEITQDIREAANAILEQYKQALEANKASGQLINTAKADVSFDGRYFTVEFLLQDYWKYLENGTKPHFPPIDAIEKWVRVKRLIPSATGGRKVPSTRQLAFLICREISIHGTKPRKTLENTLNNVDDILDKLVEVITNQLQEEINKEEI